MELRLVTNSTSDVHLRYSECVLCVVEDQPCWDTIAEGRLGRW